MAFKLNSFVMNRYPLLPGNQMASEFQFPRKALFIIHAQLSQDPGTYGLRWQLQ